MHHVGARNKDVRDTIWRGKATAIAHAGKWNEVSGRSDRFSFLCSGFSFVRDARSSVQLRTGRSHNSSRVLTEYVLTQCNHFNSWMVPAERRHVRARSGRSIKDVRDNLASQNERDRVSLRPGHEPRARVKYRVFNAVIHCLLS